MDLIHVGLLSTSSAMALGLASNFTPPDPPTVTWDSDAITFDDDTVTWDAR